MFALISTEELEGLNQIMVKQLKNRYNDPTIFKRFIVGIDRAKMRLYDCEQKAQEDVLDSGSKEDYNEEKVPKKPQNLNFYVWRFNTHNDQQQISITQDRKLTWISMLYSWMVSHPVPVKIINLFLRVLVPLTERVQIFEQYFLTAAVGISAEGGEFMEIVKKMVFQGKPWNHDNREHLIIELGDVMWYVMQACAALECINLEDVVAGNVEKLKKRYPGGEFDVHKSENRAANDR